MVSTPIAALSLVAFSLFAMIGAWLAYRAGMRRASTAALELSSLNEAGRQLLRSQLNVEALCDLVYWHAGQIVPTALFQLGLFEGDAYRVVVWAKDSERVPPKVFVGAATRGIVGWVRHSGQPLLVRDFDSERNRLPAFPEFDLDDPPKSGLFIPLIAGTATIGVIAIQSRQSGRFSEEHQRLLTSLANQAAWAIRNAQLLEHAERRAEQLRLIGGVTAQISSVQPLPNLFRQIVTLTREAFGYYCVNIFIFEGDSLKIGASTNSDFERDAPIISPGIGLVGFSGAQSTTIVANNVTKDARYRQIEILRDTHSEITLPLRVENRVLGVLDVQSDQLNAFSADDVTLLETLASQIALAIEQAQTYDAERRLAQRLEALIKVNQAVVSVLDLDELLDRLVDLVSDTFGYKRVHIFLRVGEQLIFRAGVGPHSVRWLIDGLVYGLDAPGLIPSVARSGVPELVGDVAQSLEYRPGPGLEDTRAELVVPMAMAGHLLGIIDLQSERVNAFTREDLILMQSLADSVAVSIRNAALYVNERRRSNLAETLREISASIASDLNLDSVLGDILERLSRVVSLDSAAVLLVEEGSATLTLMATWGRDLEGIVGHQLPIGPVDADDPRDLEQKVTEAYHDLLGLTGNNPCIVTPLMVASKLIGYLIADPHVSAQYGSLEQEIVFAFASQVSVAINNARLYSGQQSEAWVTTALLQVAEAVNAQSSVGESLETIARLTALLAGVNRCVILRWDAQERVFKMGAHYPYSKEFGETPLALSPSDHPFLELATVAERPLGAGVGHHLSSPQLVSELIGTRSILGFPLRSKRELVGLLVVDDLREGKPHDPRLTNILTGIAHQTSMALEAAILQEGAAERHRLEQELQVAHQIQSSFIPDKLPTMPGWDMAATWRAARLVSGDFYDFIPLQDGRWGLVIADVADKGMPAAIFMAMCRTLIRAAAINRTSPADTLQRVNQLLFNDSHSDLFVTVFYAVWSPATGQVDYASAGHNPPLLVRGKRRTITTLTCRGIALGIVPDIKLEEKTLTMRSGDHLVAYTDGVTEAMKVSHSEWGIERLERTIRRPTWNTSEELIASILAAIDEFVAGAPQSDDITMWALKRE